MDPTSRFSSRVADYVKFRPSYPPAIIVDLADAGVLKADSVIADIGSGTGLFAKLFLDRGYSVVGVEPNADMRAAGDQFLQGFLGKSFSSVGGTAEQTGLPDKSVDVVTAAQAFHWFDVQRAKAEFCRILRGKKWVVLVWNERKVEVSPFLREYERLLKAYSPDYLQVDHRRVTEEQMREFLGAGMRSWQYDNAQEFDEEGVRGRLLSSSYAPKQGQAGYDAMMAGLGTAFQKHAVDGKVAFEYDTKVYAGRVA